MLRVAFGKIFQRVYPFGKKVFENSSRLNGLSLEFFYVVQETDTYIYEKKLSWVWKVAQIENYQHSQFVLACVIV